MRESDGIESVGTSNSKIGKTKKKRKKKKKRKGKMDEGDCDGKKRQRRKTNNLTTNSEEIVVVSPYFKDKCKSESNSPPATTDADGKKKKKKKMMMRMENNKEILVGCMKKCGKDEKAIYNTQTESANSVDVKIRKKKRTKDAKHNIPDEEKLQVSGDAPCMEKVSLDDLFSEFVYKSPAKKKMEEAKAEDDDAPLFTARSEFVEKGRTTRKKLEVVSPYFANAAATHSMTKQVKTEAPVIRMVSPYFCSTGQEEENNTVVVSLTDEKKRRSKPLTAAQKRADVYLRKTPDNTWNPPRSPFHLLQEDHAFDPWRVLVICMLLNQTTGLQAGNKSIVRFF